MIPNYWQTIQKDIVTLATAQDNKKDPELDVRVRAAAIRVIGDLTMALGVVVTLASLPYLLSSALGFALTAALGVALFAVGHDVFIFGRNFEKQHTSVKAAAASEITAAFHAVVSGRDKEVETRANAYTEGMIFQTLLNAFFKSEVAKAEGRKSPK